MTTQNEATKTGTEVTKTLTNSSEYTKTLLSILDAKDKSDTGAFTLLDKHRGDVSELYQRVEYAKGIKDTSIRGVLLEHFFADPRAAKMGDRYTTLVELKSGISSIQRVEKEQIKRRLHSVVQMLTRLCDVYVTVNRLEDVGFAVQFRGVPNSAATICRIKGAKDDDYAPFSVAQVLRLVNVNLDNLDSYAQLQERAKTKKTGAPNKDKGAGESIAASKLGTVAESVETAIAGLSFDKDGGIAPSARAKLMHLWAHMDAVLTDEQKEAARKAFEIEGDDEDEADEAVAA